MIEPLYMFLKAQKKEHKSSSMWEIMLDRIHHSNPTCLVTQKDIKTNHVSFLCFVRDLKGDSSFFCQLFALFVAHRWIGLQTIHHVLCNKTKYISKMNNEDPNDDDHEMVRLITVLIRHWHPIAGNWQRQRGGMGLGTAPKHHVNEIEQFRGQWGDHVVSVLTHTSLDWPALHRSSIVGLAKHVFYAIQNHLGHASHCLGYNAVWELHQEIEGVLDDGWVWWDGMFKQPEGVATQKQRTAVGLMKVHNAQTIEDHGKQQVQKMADAILEHNVTCITNSKGELVLLPEFKPLFINLMHVSHPLQCYQVC
jgi:hypothetical protein